MNSDARSRRSARREIRQDLQSLGSPIHILDRSCGSLNFYREHGFCLMTQQFEVEPEVIETMREKFRAPELRYIVINEGNSPARVNRMHAGRKAFVTKRLNGGNDRYQFGHSGEYVLEQIHEAVMDYAPEFFWGRSRLHFETLETILFSKESSGQTPTPRRGLRPEFEKASLIAISMMHPQSSLIIYPGSHCAPDEGRSQCRPVRFGFNAGDVLFLNPRLIFCHDYSPQSHLCVQHIVVAYPLAEEWDLVGDETESAVESLVESAVQIRAQGNDDLVREEQVGLGVQEAHRWLGDGADVVNERVRIIHGREAWAMMVDEGDNSDEWSD